jgi:DNA-binding beta-propeller fold protein YncE
MPARLRVKLVVKTDGAPEGYAVDLRRGLFYTNLEDKNRTLGFDVRTHALKTTWPTGCSDEGPRGIAVDAERSLVFVACTDGVRVLDATHEGEIVGKLDAGAGVDNIDYLEARKLLYVAAGKAARLTVARIEDGGRPVILATWPTAEGVRNAVVDAVGNAYVAEPSAARLLVFAAPSTSM